MKTDLITQYGGKILAIRNYKHPKREFFIDDFEDITKLDEVLGEIFVCESDITPAGKSFLNDYYGFEALAETLSMTGGLDNVLDPAKIRIMLEELVPMEISRFIGEARGDLRGDERLREDLTTRTKTH
jgi:hypothetical protein